MADDNMVEIRFGASTDDALAGIAQVRDALAGLTAPVQESQSSLGPLERRVRRGGAGRQLSEAIKAFKGLGNQAARTGFR